MKFHLTRTGPLATIAAGLLIGGLSGCATPVGPVEVTRFHRPELASAARGAVAIEAEPGNDPASLEFRSYAAAVGRELTRQGYGEKPGADIVAAIAVERDDLRAPRAGSPVSVGVGGSTGGYGSGLGVGLGINLSGGPKDMVETRLSVTLRERASGRALWEGRARFAVRTDSPLAGTQLGAAKMAQALFEGFPGTSGETIVVK